MTRKHRAGGLVLVIIALPILGYVLTYGMNLIMPMSEHGTGYHLALVIAIFAMGMLVPYFMIKLLSRAGHLVDPQEKEVRMRDIPKDKDDFERTMRSMR